MSEVSTALREFAVAVRNEYAVPGLTAEDEGGDGEEDSEEELEEPETDPEGMLTAHHAFCILLC